MTNTPQINLKEIKNTNKNATGFIVRFKDKESRFPTLFVRQSDIKMSECEQFLVIHNATCFKDGVIINYVKRKGWWDCDDIEVSTMRYHSTIIDKDAIWVATNTVMQLEEFSYDWYLKKNSYTEKQYEAYCRRVNALARRHSWLAIKLYKEDSYGWTPKAVRYGFIKDEELYNHVNAK